MDPNKLREHRPYRLNDVKRCYGRAGDGMILQWFHRGLITGEMIPRGSMMQLSFSFAELVHIGTVMELVRLGLTKKPKETKIWCFLYPKDQYKEFYFIDDSTSLVDLYVATNFDICLEFYVYEHHVEGASKRNKRQEAFNMGGIFRPLGALYQMGFWLHEMRGAKEEIDSETIVAMSRSARVYINIPFVATAISDILGIKNPWVSDAESAKAALRSIKSQIFDMEMAVTDRYNKTSK